MGDGDMLHSETPYMAHDELIALEYADTPEKAGTLAIQMELRRRAMDRFSRSRLDRLAWNHDAIQQLFDFLHLPLHPLE